MLVTLTETGLRGDLRTTCQNARIHWVKAMPPRLMPVANCDGSLGRGS